MSRDIVAHARALTRLQLAVAILQDGLLVRTCYVIGYKRDSRREAQAPVFTEDGFLRLPDSKDSSLPEERRYQLPSVWLDGRQRKEPGQLAQGPVGWPYSDVPNGARPTKPVHDVSMLSLIHI